MKRLFTISFVLLCIMMLGSTAWGQLLFEENFNYPIGDSLNVMHGWVVQPTASYSNTIKVVAGGLTYTNYPSVTGDAAGLKNTGQDLYHVLSSSPSSGSVYATALINVSAAQATGDYFMHFTDVAGGTNFGIRTFIKSSGAGFVMGLSKSNETPQVYGSTVLALNTTHLVVLKYTFNTGTGFDDSAYIYVNPIVGSPEPAVAEVRYAAPAKADYAQLAVFNLRQGSAANAPTLSIDGIRVGTSWNAVLPINCPTFNFGVVLPTGTTGSAYVGGVTAYGGTDPYTYTVKAGSSLPAGLSLSTSGAFTGTPTVHGTGYSFTITATDANTCATDTTLTMDINCPSISIVETTLPGGTAGTAYSASLTGAGGTSAYTFATTDPLPTGVSLGSNGAFSGTPTVTGTFPITVSVTDANGCIGTPQAYSLVISCGTITVSPASDTLPNGSTGVVYSQAVTAGGGIAPYTYSLFAGTMPDGLTLNADGTITGTPTTVGTTTGITVRATDAILCTGDKVYSLTVAATFVCPTITISGPAQDGHEGIPGYTHTYTAAGGTAPYVFSASGTLPTGLSLSADGVLSGTPSAAGEYIFQVGVIDANACTASFADTVTVILCPTFTFDPTTLPDGVAGTAYNQTITVTGGLAPYAFTIVAGALPTGMALSGAGVVSGTPTATGPFTVAVSAFDANGCPSSQEYTFNIACPTITVNPAAYIFPRDTVGKVMSKTFTSVGGVGTVLYSSTGTLPGGLTLSTGGVLSGNPNAGGIFSFSIVATDANGCTGSRAYLDTVFAPGTFRVANTGLDVMTWDSTGTWILENGTSLRGYPGIKDTVILDNKYHAGSYTVTCGLHFRDSARVLIISYPENTANTIRLEIPLWADSVRNLVYGDGLGGNYDLTINKGGVLFNGSKFATSYNLAGLGSPSPDSIMLHAGGKIVWASNAYPNVIYGLNRGFNGDYGIVEYDPQSKFSDFNWGNGYVYPNLVLSNTHGAPKLFIYGGGKAICKGDLTINAGVVDSLGMTNGAFMVFGNIINNGITKVAGCPLVMAGSTAQTITGSQPIKFDSIMVYSASTWHYYNGCGLAVANAAGVTTSVALNVLHGKVQTGGNIDSVGAGFPAVGTLNLGGTTLSLTPGGSLQEGLNPIVGGPISATRVLTTTANEQFGNIGFEVEAAGVAPDTTTIVRTTGAALHNGDGNPSINRYFTVTPKVSEGVTANVVLHYQPVDLGSMDENSLLLNRTPDGGTNWFGASATLDAVNHKLSAIGATGLASTWTASSNNAPLVLLHAITVKQTASSDGNINNPATQTPKRTWLYLYAGSVAPENQVGLNLGTSLVVSGLVAGTYIAVEEDSSINGWMTIGHTHTGVTFASSSRFDTITVAHGAADSVIFINQKAVTITINKLVTTTGNVADGIAHAWGLTLVKYDAPVSTPVSSVNNTTLTAGSLLAGTYIASEADSGASWKQINGNQTLADTFTVVGGEIKTVTFVNFKPNTVSVNVKLDPDGQLATSGDQVIKPWHFELRQDGPSGTVVGTSDNGELIVNNLGDGSYYPVLADSSNFILLGFYLDGVLITPAPIAVAGGQAKTASYVMASSAYLMTYRTIQPESLAVSVDNAGKLGKYVALKTDKSYFTFTLTTPATGDPVTGVYFEFASKIVASMPYSIDPAGTWTPKDGKLQKYTVTFNAPLSAGQTVTFTGYAVKAEKIAKYNWIMGLTNGASIPGKPVVFTNVPKWPMPNRINVAASTFAHQAKGYIMPVGETTLDKKYYGWLQMGKYTDLMATVVAKGVQHTGTPWGLDRYVTGKPILGKLTSLPPSKQNNLLVAGLAVLKLNIQASIDSVLPNGLGELLFNDPATPNIFNGMLVRDIAAEADTLMMGYLVDTTIKGKAAKAHHFVNADTFQTLYNTIAAINMAFEGPIDTTAFAGSSKLPGALALKGTKQLSEVPYLHLSGVAPTKSSPVASQEQQAVVPVSYALYQNYPNPFNPTTTLRYDLPMASIVTLKIYNILGQEVATLLNNAQVDEGQQEVVFSATKLSSGVYFYRLDAQSIATGDGSATERFTKISKMMLIK